MQSFRFRSCLTCEIKDDTIVQSSARSALIKVGQTSVGTASIRHFLRPVCYQNMPDVFWPNDF
jgi:alpha-ketoglutaric semialdehyde dehydrogenase